MTFEVNANFNINVAVSNPLDKLKLADQCASRREIILERTRLASGRVTSLLLLPVNSELTNLNAVAGTEILVLHGTCHHDGEEIQTGTYLRFPNIPKLTSANGCLLFIKYNQFLSSDDSERIISTHDQQKWLPGPVEGITIRPLHVFNTESIMLLRWQHACEFRPKLNPQGEEILVIEGLLQNRDRLYKPYSWIRNPIPDWRDWHGSTGTLLYYKSGHFPTDSQVSSAAG